jgi:hypothetical protein
VSRDLATAEFLDADNLICFHAATIARVPALFCSARSYLNGMELTLVQDYAIQARLAAIIGPSVFDRVFSGVRFAEADGPLLYVYAKNESAAAEIEDDFSLSSSRTLRVGC